MRRTQRRWALVQCLCVAGLGLGSSGRAHAEEASPTVHLVVNAGRPLRAALDERVRVKRVGQRVVATLVEPVYAYDRVVVPVGAKILGHVSAIHGPSRVTRVRALMAGDLTPVRLVEVEFDTLVLSDRQLAIETIVTNRTEYVRLLVAGGSDSATSDGQAARARADLTQAGHDLERDAKNALAMITQPGRMARLKDMAIQRLPYHPQFLTKGTVYDAELEAPLDFGLVTPIERARGTQAAPSSILNARLVTAVDSASSPRGTPIVAVMTEPVFSAEHLLVLPEGTELRGDVTLSRRAGRFHRNGQLRLLFETVHPPDEAPAKLLASLHSVQASRDAHVALDEEGGTTITNSKTRFVAPALALLALNASADVGGEPDIGNLGAASSVEAGNVAGRGLGGFFGFGLLGVGISQFSRPVAVGLAAVGAARTVYSSVFGKGKEVAFPADTPIQLQLAPAAK